MQIFIVVNTMNDWPLDIPGIEVLEADQYLMNPCYSTLKNVKVFNLCRSYRYQTIGYYVSLIAAARGHKPQPSLMGMQDLKTNGMVRFISSELDELIQESLHGIHSARFTLSIYFGKNLAKRYDKLCSHLFKEFQAPFLRAQFAIENGKWSLRSISTIAGNDIPEEHREFIIGRAQEYFSGKKIHVPKKNNYRYDLAILYNPEEKHPPSNKKAIARFIKAAESLGLSTEMIQKEDIGRIAEFDALFIRETTNVNHHTYRFARRAAAEGLVTIDDPESILRCTNKVFLAEIMDTHGVPTPTTIIVDKNNTDEVLEKLGFPFVLKQPDSAFSHGVVKIENVDDFVLKRAPMLEKSDLLIAQQFMPTAFDWRIGVFNQQPLYACKYYMARKHWQIYEHHLSGKTYVGRYETIPVSQVPKHVIRIALKASNLIGDGLYGVDLKEIDNKCYVMEINDNPNIDNGIEDHVLQDELYNKLMSIFLYRIEKKKQPV